MRTYNTIRFICCLIGSIPTGVCAIRCADRLDYTGTLACTLCSFAMVMLAVHYALKATPRGKQRLR